LETVEKKLKEMKGEAKVIKKEVKGMRKGAKRARKGVKEEAKEREICLTTFRVHSSSLLGGSHGTTSTLPPILYPGPSANMESTSFTMNKKPSSELQSARHGTLSHWSTENWCSAGRLSKSTVGIELALCIQS